ncbi:MAG TPA: hypothetical protein VGR73_17630 [Bryobacteraceae bacterium]|nr:hypothetical protein [Bryobacteraceae bacterium]
MDLLTKDDFFRPHPNFDDGINRAICQSEIEGGVNVNELPPGALLEVETQYHTYQVVYHCDGEMTISGHPEFCPDPVRVHLAGSTWGTPMIKVRFIGRGMKMEFIHPELGIIQTSRVRDVRELPSPRFSLAEKGWSVA